MAYNGFTTTAYFSESANPASMPFTMACWFNSTSSTLGQNLMTIQAAGNNTNYFGLSAEGATGGDPVNAYVGTGAGIINCLSTTGYSANTWHHVCGVFISATSRAVYLDGGSSATSATSRSPTVDTQRIGVFKGSGAASNPLAGSIAEIGIWSAELTAAEIASLAKGMSPALIRPQSLVRYRPFVRSTQCVRSGATLTATGAPTVAVHPRIYKSA